MNDMTHPQGFDAMGKPIPDNRRQCAYDHAKSMGVKDPWALVGGMADSLERDQPYDAMRKAKGHVDLTGAYRVMAVLLCPTPDEHKAELTAKRKQKRSKEIKSLNAEIANRKRRLKKLKDARND